MKKKIATSEIGPEDELLLRCDCGASHYLSISFWKFQDVEEYYLEVIEEWRSPSSLWQRLRALWTFFRTGKYHSASVLLNEPGVQKLNDWIQGRG